jgi:hypothetical protein
MKKLLQGIRDPSTWPGALATNITAQAIWIVGGSVLAAIIILVIAIIEKLGVAMTFTLVMVVLATGVSIAANLPRLFRSNASPPAEIASPSGRFTIPPLPGQFYQQVFVFKGEVDLTNLDKDNPFLLFTFWFFNGSSSDQIYFQKLSGHVRFNKEEQSPEVEFFSGNMTMNFGLGRGGFTIRQWLTRESAKTIEQTITFQGRMVQFHFDAVYAMIGRTGDESKAAHRLDLPPIIKRDETAWVTGV